MPSGIRDSRFFLTEAVQRIYSWSICYSGVDCFVCFKNEKCAIESWQYGETSLMDFPRSFGGTAPSGSLRCKGTIRFKVKPIDAPVTSSLLQQYITQAIFLNIIHYAANKNWLKQCIWFLCHHIDDTACKVHPGRKFPQKCSYIAVCGITRHL